jgi:AAA+ superfamily predicted ATPase
VFLTAATNHQHLLDPAIWRRFNWTIMMDMPNSEQRKDMIIRETSLYSLKIDSDLDLVVNLTEGMNGAQVCELVQSLARNKYISGSELSALRIEDITQAIFKQLTMATQNDSESLIKVIQNLRDKGISIRALEKITGIPRSTLSYRLNSEGNSNA